MSDIIGLKNIDFNEFETQETQGVPCTISRNLSDVKFAVKKTGENQRIVVLKHLYRSNKDDYYKDLRREATNLMEIHDNNDIVDNVIKFIGITKDPKRECHSMVLQYCSGKDLRTYLEQNFSEMEWPSKIKIATDIANGLTCIHNSNIVHCDLNSENILENDGKWMIVSFSSSVSLNDRIDPSINKSSDSEKVVYIDPKCLDFQHNYKKDKPSDIYSLGVLLWEISSGRPPFNKELDILELKQRLRNKIRETPINGTPVDYKELYCNAWDDNPKKRPSIEEVKLCLQDIDFEHEYQDANYIPQINYRDISDLPPEKEACLTVIQGNSNKKYLFLTLHETFIGRSNSNHIIIKDQKIGKQHANIKSHQGKIEIIDLGSQSGIYVNNERLMLRNSHTLKEGDLIKMGNSSFKYLPAGEYEKRLDPKLRIYNADYFKNTLEDEFANAKKEKNDLSLLFVDIDHFKKINDSYGHDVGDYTLNKLVTIIKSCIRPEDTFARFGGEEFTIILKNTSTQLAVKTAEEIRASVKGFSFSCKEKTFRITVSVGVAEVNSLVESSDDLIKITDEALYKAKSQGRDRVVIWKIDSDFIKTVKDENHWEQSILGECYQHGIGVKKDEKEAFKWYLKSAEGEDSSGQLNLGNCYQNGIGTLKDNGQAFRLYSKSAEGGSVIGQNKLGEAYQYGYGTEKNSIKAFEWYLKSAEGGYALGQYNTGSCYENGNGAMKDFEKAFEWYFKSAEGENLMGQLSLGDCYQNGRGTNKDFAKAFEWYLKSAKGGNAIGQNKLGDAYQYGFGTEKNSGKAFEWYLKSAEGGDALGQYNTGNCFENGSGTMKDDKKAFEWYLASAKNGNADAQRNLADFYQNGIGITKDKEQARYWYEQYVKSN